MVLGQSVEACLALTAKELMAALGGLPLGKHHCARLAIDALRDALAKSDAVVAGE
jgi:NifU-like protein involved in Fe-S cluster formation